MSDTEILNNLFKNEIKLISEKHLNKNAVLHEPKSPGSSVEILNLPEDAMIIKSDFFKSPDSVFKGLRGECRRADYVIISESMKCIVFIEMKTGGSDNSEIIQQLKGSLCFIRYCREVGRIFWDNLFLSGYHERFVKITNTSHKSQKRSTKISKELPLNDTPENARTFRRISSINFKQLHTPV